MAQVSVIPEHRQRWFNGNRVFHKQLPLNGKKTAVGHTRILPATTGSKADTKTERF